MITAYEMALHPTTSLIYFKVLIDVQRKNRLKFIEGKLTNTTLLYYLYKLCYKVIKISSLVCILKLFVAYKYFIHSRTK